MLNSDQVSDVRNVVFLANSVFCKFAMGYKEKVLSPGFAPCTLI